MFIGASWSLKSLCCLLDGVCYLPVPLAGWEEKGESAQPRKGWGRNGNKEGTNRHGRRQARRRNGWVTKRNEKRLGKEREGRKSGEIYLLSCGREIESRVGQPTTKTHPLHYAHRSRDLNVPLEMVVCSCTEKTHVVKVPGRELLMAVGVTSAKIAAFSQMW